MILTVLRKMRHDNQHLKFDPADRLLLIQQERLVREEGRKTRSTVWLAVFVLIACIVFSPLLFIATPIVLIILGIGALAAMAGTLAGKYFSRRRERAIMEELRARTFSVVEGQFGKSNDAEQDAAMKNQRKSE